MKRTPSRLTSHLVRRCLGDDTGAALIEMAIVIPMVLWLMMGIIEYGIIFHLMSLSTYAADEASRLGKTGDLNGQKTRQDAIVNKVTTIFSPWMTKNSKLTVSEKAYGAFDDLGGSGTPGAGAGGQIVVYTVTFDWPVLTPVLGAVFGKNGKVPITTKVIVKNEDF